MEENNEKPKKNSVLKNFTTLQTLLIFAGALMAFGLITLVITVRGISDLDDQNKSLKRDFQTQQQSINDLSTTWTAHQQSDSIAFVGIGNDLTRHDEEIKTLQKRPSGASTSYVKSVERRLFQVEKDLSTHLIVPKPVNETVATEEDDEGDDEGDNEGDDK